MTNTPLLAIGSSAVATLLKVASSPAPWKIPQLASCLGAAPLSTPMARHPVRPHLANRLRQRQSNPSGPSLRRHAGRLKIDLPFLFLFLLAHFPHICICLSCCHHERSEEGSRVPRRSTALQTSPTRPSICLLQPKTVISAEVHSCERRSGEIRFLHRRYHPSHKFHCSYFMEFYSFAIFRPKITCQAPKPPNPSFNSNIRVAYELGSTRYTGYIDRKTSKPRDSSGANSLRCNILDVTHLL